MSIDQSRTLDGENNIQFIPPLYPKETSLAVNSPYLLMRDYKCIYCGVKKKIV